MTYNWLPTGETTQVIQATEQVTYVVTVTNADGCEFSDDFRIGTECISYYHIPSAFSPNGDNLNDVFKPTLKNYQDYSMVIYNRWGEELYRSENPDMGWDGIYQGKEVSNGVYMYSIRFITTENGQFQTVKGLVNVLR
jgi:gliding motility-associated-like protein